MSLEQQCEAAVLVGPGNFHCVAPIVGAVDPGHVRHHNGFELAGIEMPPAPRTVIIARAWVTTGRTTEWLISVYLNTNMNRFLTLHKSDIGDRPGMSKSQYFGIECQFVHGNYSIFTHYDWGRANIFVIFLSDFSLLDR